MRRPQDPIGPLPYTETEVVFRSGKGDIPLSGTLTHPNPEQKAPAVVLITGSGPQNRDEEMADHRPFAVLADHLTRSGLAVLRYDGRGLGEPLERFFNSHVREEFIADAIGAVRFLKGREGIDDKRIGLVGHSDGANVAVAASLLDPDISYVVMMAGPGLVGERILMDQYEKLFRLHGTTPAEAQKQLTYYRNVFEVAKTEPDSEKARRAMRKAYEENIGKIGLFNRSTFERASEVHLSPWMRAYLTRDPVDELKQVKCPVLVLNGELDVQVDCGTNTETIKSALENGHNPSVTVTTLPGLNHLFQTAKTGDIKEYQLIPETMSPIAMETIQKWIMERNAVHRCPPKPAT